MPSRDAMVLEHVFCRPWALHAPVYQTLCDVVHRHSRGVKLEQPEIDSIVEGRRSDGPMALVGNPGDARDQLAQRGYIRRGAVGVVPIGGLIAPHASMVNGMSQPRGTGVDAVRQGLANMLADWRAGEIGAGLLHIESPGGYVGGVEALGEDIRRAREQGFTLWGLGTDILASAAYWIGASAGKLYIESESTDVGSIGVIVGRLDLSRALANEGIGWEFIRSADLKALGQPQEPMSPTERAQWQELVNETRDVFVQAVAKGRGVSVETAASWATGRTWGAAKAPAGMHDGVRHAADVLAELQQIATRDLNGRTSTPAGAGMHERTRTMPQTSPQTSASSPAQQLSSAAGTTNPVTAPDPAASQPPAQPAGQAAGQPAADPLAAERARVASIMDRAASFADADGVRALADQAVRDGTSAEAFGQRLLTHIAEQRRPVQTAGDVQVGTDQWDKKRDAAVLAMIVRHDPAIADRARRDASHGHDIARAVGYDDPQLLAKAVAELNGSGMRHMRLMDLAELCAAQTGQPFVRGNYDSVFAVAFGSGRSDLPNIFSSAMNRTLLAAGAAVPTVYDRVCRIGSATDFRDRNLISMSAFPDLDLIPAGDKPKEASVSDRTEAIRVLTYGTKLSWTRQMIIDDDLGAMMRVMEMIGRAIRRKPDLLLAALINANAAMSDGTALFHADHNNLASSGAAPGQSTIQAMITAMRLQKSFGQGSSVISPVRLAMILCPATLEFTVRKYQVNEYDPDTTAGVMARNQIAGMFDTVPFPELDAYSTTAWYGLADPSDRVLFECDFLQGNRNGTVTRVGDGSILGVDFEVIHDCGIKAVEFEAGYKNPGAGG